MGNARLRVAVRDSAATKWHVEATTMRKGEGVTRAVVEALLAVAGIWLAVHRLPEYSAMLLWSVTANPLQVGGGPSVLVIQSVYMVASLGGGLLLISTRKLVSQWLYRGEAEATVDGRTLVGAGAAIIACYVIVNGAVALGTYFAARRGDAQDVYLLWNGAIALVSGLILFILSPWLGRLWTRLAADPRTGGRS